jgi:hypothetical protein
MAAAVAHAGRRDAPSGCSIVSPAFRYTQCAEPLCTMQVSCAPGQACPLKTPFKQTRKLWLDVLSH